MVFLDASTLEVGNCDDGLSAHHCAMSRASYSGIFQPQYLPMWFII
jgi:hypothetical protein